jgi:hypothetical protein
MQMMNGWLSYCRSADKDRTTFEKDPLFASENRKANRPQKKTERCFAALVIFEKYASTAALFAEGLSALNFLNRAIVDRISLKTFEYTSAPRLQPGRV